jgi:hypothetical protein
VQARRNGWELAGVDGNRRPPINRETYKVTETRDDGGLVVDRDGERLTLPGDYVKHHVALGYSSTAHSAQATTVDTSHVIAIERTGQSSLYVGMSRGREANHAYVVTQTVPEDAAPGMVNEREQQHPLDVLAATAERDEPEQAAVATSERNAADAQSPQAVRERRDDGREVAQQLGKTNEPEWQTYLAEMDSAVDDANRRDEQHRVAQLNQWHANEQQPATKQQRAHGNDDELVLERGF